VGFRRVCLLGLLAQTAASVPSVRAGEPADPALALPPPARLPPWRAALSFQSSLGGEYLNRGGQDLLLHAAKAKLGLEAEPHPTARLAVTVLVKHYSGDTTFPAASYLPDDAFAALLPPDGASGRPGMADVIAYPYASALTLQQAYGEYGTARLSLRIGRQLHLSGVGQGFRPTDLFNLSNPADPMWEPDGHDGIRLAVGLPSGARLEGFVEMGPRLSRSNFMVRAAAARGPWRAAGSYTRRWQTQTDWQRLNTPAGLAAYAARGFAELRRSFRWDQVAAEAEGALGGSGVRAEAGFVFIRPPSEPGSLVRAGGDHLRLLLGADRTIDAGPGPLTALVEYTYLGQGRSRARDLDLNDRLMLLAGEVQGNARHTAYFSLSQGLGPRFAAGLRGQVAAIAPANALLYPFVTWQPLEAVAADLFAVLPLGSRRGAYGNLGPGVYLWLRFELEAGASRGPAGGALVAPENDADNRDSTAGASG
jgi:hypothetical protein